VPGKNIRELEGKPLIAYTILQAKACRLFDDIAVSSDSEEILNISRRWGATVLVRRPAELSTDQSPKLPTIQHCVGFVEAIKSDAYDLVADLDATAPLRTPRDLTGAVSLAEKNPGCNVITGVPARRSPYFNLVEVDEKGFARLAKQVAKPITRRQDAPLCYDMNASIYVWWKEDLLKSKRIIDDKTLLYEMAQETFVDVDSETDFEIMSYLFKKGGYDRL